MKMANTGEMAENIPDWLPPGWETEVRVGKKDRKSKCYTAPSGCKFYSKKSVCDFLETGKSNNHNSTPNVVVQTESTVEGLPPGWIKVLKARRSGNRRDPYYIDPVTGYSFRSKDDALRYLGTGEVGKHVMKLKRSNKEPINLEISVPTERETLELVSKKAKRSLFACENFNRNQAVEDVRILESFVAETHIPVSTDVLDQCKNGGNEGEGPNEMERNRVCAENWNAPEKHKLQSDAGMHGKRKRNYTDDKEVDVPCRASTLLAKFIPKPILDLATYNFTEVSSEREKPLNESNSSLVTEKQPNESGKEEGNQLMKKLGTDKNGYKVIETEDWLPTGWNVEVKTRKTGRDVGKIYKVYIAPSGCRFYSKKALFHYLKTRRPNSCCSTPNARDIGDNMRSRKNQPTRLVDSLFESQRSNADEAEDVQIVQSLMTEDQIQASVDASNINEAGDVQIQQSFVTAFANTSTTNEDEKDLHILQQFLSENYIQASVDASNKCGKEGKGSHKKEKNMICAENECGSALPTATATALQEKRMAQNSLGKNRKRKYRSKGAKNVNVPLRSSKRLANLKAYSYCVPSASKTAKIPSKHERPPKIDECPRANENQLNKSGEMLGIQKGKMVEGDQDDKELELPVILPYIDLWTDPCSEYAFNTLIGANSTEDNLFSGSTLSDIDTIFELESFEKLIFAPLSFEKK
ncbi:hypothetical protein GIB67_040700 [Kingdonia uniflora]|uniref:MBD domain-containing protein n=1 Tax=Kingdonia uniflora TaxID=39325 RepID=A0A7J7KUA6_9MAGN|nr:hypothetical protein GIB67_040700 [Kingdonia uniflora]